MVYYGNCVQEKVLRVANVDNRHGGIFLVTGITSSLWKKFAFSCKCTLSFHRVFNG